jgi:hypothetical protein
MRIRLVIILLLATIRLAYCQQQTVIAKFTVQSAKKNHTDVTQYYTSNNAYFAFYITADKQVYFGSIVSRLNQQSYGAIFGLTHTAEPETTSSYATDTFNFKWSYSNSYDNHQGAATVKLVKIDKPGGVAFELKIIPENLDLLEYSGYMEGSLKLD